jgi:hypothetical protein
MPKGEKRDYHKILDVSRNATEDEIKAAYKKMVNISAAIYVTHSHFQCLGQDLAS